MRSTSLIEGTKKVNGNVTTEEHIEVLTEGAKFLARKVKITCVKDDEGKVKEEKREVLEEKVLASF